MALAAVAVDFDHTLDVERDFSSQVALDKVVVLDDLTQLRDVVLGQIRPGWKDDLYGMGRTESAFEI